VPKVSRGHRASRVILEPQGCKVSKEYKVKLALKDPQERTVLPWFFSVL
jgi:hypothetical protein